MIIRKLIAMLLVPGLIAAAFAAPPTTPALRKSPDFAINDTHGKTTMLSNFRGKVVVVEFLFVRSEHCLRVAQTLNRLQAQLGARGFQPVGIAFDAPNAAMTGGQYLDSMVEMLKLTYPVGHADKEEVDTYLGRTGKELLSIPQIVVIDRSGNIRAVNGDRTDPKLEDEESLRTLLDALLKEPVKS
jgi:peroxiredoxin